MRSSLRLAVQDSSGPPNRHYGSLSVLKLLTRWARPRDRISGRLDTSFRKRSTGQDRIPGFFGVIGGTTECPGTSMFADIGSPGRDSRGANVAE